MDSPGRDLHDGLLPGPGAAGGDAAALGLGGDLRGADLDDVHVEQRLDGLLDLRLVRLVVHAERVLVGGRQDVALLGDDRADDHLAVVHLGLRLLAGARREVVERAPGESTSVAARTRSATPTSSTCRTCTRERLRKDLAAVSSSSASATSTAPPRWASSRLGGLRGARRVEARRVDHVDRAALGVHRQRAAQRGAAGLAVDLEDVVSAGSGRRPCRRPSRSASGRCRRVRGRCPSGATASRRRRGPCRGSWSSACPDGARPARPRRPRARAGR